MANGFTINGLDYFEKLLFGIAEQKMPQLIKEMLDQLGFYLLREIKRRTPVGYGRLKGSFTRGDPDNIWEFDKVGRNFILKVGTNVDYAELVEEGHQQHERWLPGTFDSSGKFRYDSNAFDPETGQEGIMLTEKFIPGYHMFELGMDQLENYAPAYLKEKLKEAFHELII